MADTRAALPAAFGTLLKHDDLAAIEDVFRHLDVNAVTGYAHWTALSEPACGDEVTRWLVGHGADLERRDDFGRTAMHYRSQAPSGRVEVLIELGAALDPVDKHGDTPLHWAATRVNARTAEVLVAAGADVGAVNSVGMTPLELALASCGLGDIPRAVRFSEIVLAAGAPVSTGAQNAVAALGERFEFHRPAMKEEPLEAEAALDVLYRMFSCAPVEPIVRHDGVSPIVMPAVRWQENHEFLWNHLVPPHGTAPTVQGEVIRAAGKIGREVLDNGMVNWDQRWDALMAALAANLATGVVPETLDLAETAAIGGRLRELRPAGGDAATLARQAVEWVGTNPMPVPRAVDERGL